MIIVNDDQTLDLTSCELNTTHLSSMIPSKFHKSHKFDISCTTKHLFPLVLNCEAAISGFLPMAKDTMDGNQETYH